MADSKPLWIVKTEQGTQKGPYTTQEVLKHIEEGAFLGSEKIKNVIDNKWIPITKEVSFYDHLLRVLEKQAAPHVEQETGLPAEMQETIIEMPTQLIPAKKVKQLVTEENTNSEITDADAFQTASAREKRPEDINNLSPTERVKREIDDSVVMKYDIPKEPELTPLRTSPRRELAKKKKSQVAGAIAVAVILVGALIFLALPEKSIDSKSDFNLTLPRFNSPNKLEQKQVDALLKGAVTSFSKDTFEGYVEAQNKLVTAIEGSPQTLPPRAYLCMVYKQLWPFVKQNSKDIDAVMNLSKSTRIIDPIGLSGVYCEVIKMIILGKDKEARGFLDHYLGQSGETTDPALYVLKAELLSHEKQYKTAALYALKAKELWPTWIKTTMDYAYDSLLDGDKKAALDNFREVTKLQPQHKEAQVEYADLLYRDYAQPDTAFNILTGTLSSPGRMNKTVEIKAYLTLASLWLTKNDERKALAMAQKAYELNPANDEAKNLVQKLGGNTKIAGLKNASTELVYLGDQYARSGDCLAAQAEYKTAFEIDPTEATAAMKAAKCLWQLGQNHEAIFLLNKSISADPKLIPAYGLLADYLSAQFDYTGAIQALNKATQVFPNNYEILKGYGLVELRRNNIKESTAYLQRSLKLYDNDVDTLILLAKALAANKDLNAAQNYAIKAIELDSTNTEAQVVYAKILAQFQGIEIGIAYVKDLINKFSYTVDYRLALAEIYALQENYKLSQQIYEQVLEIDPKNKKANIGLGESLQAQNLYDRALKYFLNAAVIDPSDAEGLFKAGLLYLDAGKNKEAVVQFRRALSVNPNFPRLHYYIGRAAFLSSDFNLALSEGEEERKLNPNLADSYLLEAEVYFATRQYQKCATEYQSAIKLRQQGADIYVKIAKCYLLAGSPDVAESMLTIASNKESGMPEIYKAQGEISESRGDNAAAITAYEKYLLLSPNAPDKGQIEMKVLSLKSGH